MGTDQLLEGALAASNALGESTTIPGLAHAALDLARDLTGSPVAFLALVGEDGRPERVFSRAADSGQGTSAGIPDEALVAAPELNGAGTSELEPTSTQDGHRSHFAHSLRAGGRLIGRLGVVNPHGLSAAHQQAFAVFAHQVAAAIALAQVVERRNEMVDALINLKADLDRSEKEKLLTEERARSADRVERAHEAAVDALLAVSRHAQSGRGRADFVRGLTRSIARLVGARGVVFWKLEDEGFLLPVPGTHGFGDGSLSRLGSIRSDPGSDDLASRVVFHDMMFRASRAELSGDFRHMLDALAASNAIAVPWRAGEHRLGMVAAYESRRGDGFSREDTWVLQKAGLAAGLVWQLRYTETGLRKTVDRLHEVDAARHLLLRHVSTAADDVRKQLARELHDEALQKLTAAELQLRRVQELSTDNPEPLAEAQELLAQTEDALRRLLFDARPTGLEVPGGLADTIQERIRRLRALTAADVQLDLDLPDDLSLELSAMLFRQVNEAVSNIEKHAAATSVRISLRTDNGGILGAVEDNGRGFVVAERDRLPGHLGLLALDERALLAGGWNRIQSRPGNGTRLEFWLPLT